MGTLTRMPCLSLWEPWATATALEATTVETRSWSTKVRGRIAIHAAKRKITRDERANFVESTEWAGAMTPLGAEWLDRLSYGLIVCTCVLKDCLPTESFGEEVDIRRSYGIMNPKCKWTERDLGNYLPGRFGFVLAKVQRLREPIPWKGNRGFFTVEIEA